ncbi:MAG: sulfate reduction electron transfer complex DsrMKJOP subunit DsrM [bacterium]
MMVLISFITIAVFFLIAYASASMGLQSLFGVVVPYIAVAIFFAGLIYKVMNWANSPVPFRITTTCGQQKSLHWLKRERFDNPFTALEVIVRMLLEILLFRSLLRNTNTKIVERRKLIYSTSLWLWLGAIAFHWSFLIVLIRHIRLFTEPTPFFVTVLQDVDGFMQVGVPVYYATSFILIIALAYLLIRRLVSPQLRYISLYNDYFPLFLLLGIAVSGFWLRYIGKTDLTAIKELTMGLVSFNPVVPAGINPLFFGHLFLVSILLAYFPFSKLMHMAGVFLSPTRNLANNNRAKRHVNPWDYPVKVHTYEEYEDEFRDLMKEVEIPVDKD